MTEKIRVDAKGHTLLIGLNRPEKRNAIDSDMIRGLAAAYTRLADDDDLRCGVVYAEGPHFCGGLDLADMTPKMMNGDSVGSVQSQFMDKGQCDPFRLAGRECEKPVIFAVQGRCYTAAVELILAADMCVATSDTIFGQMETSRGIFPLGGATARMPALFGWHNAMRYLVTGDTFDAEEGRRLGLVQEIVDPGNQVERALELAEMVNSQAPLGVRATLVNARLGRREGEVAALAALLPAFQEIFRSEDAREGMASMMQKRDPVFKGR